MDNNTGVSQIFNKITNYVVDAVSYPKYESYESRVSHTYRSDNDNYRIYIMDYGEDQRWNSFIDLLLSKNNPQFVSLYNEIHKDCYLQFDCIVKYPFATPEIINVTKPHLNKTIAIIEEIIVSPYIRDRVWHNRCEIILKNDNNQYIGFQNIHSKYKHLIGLKCVILWHKPICATRRYVDNIVLL